MGANGTMVDPEPAARFGCEVMIESRVPDTEWQSVYFPERLRDRVKLRNVAKDWRPLPNQSRRT